MFRSALLASFSLFLAACLPEVRPFTCETAADCAEGQSCTSFGECADPPEPPDAPVPFSRDVCLVGPAMPAGRDTCVDLVCARDTSCCALGWSERCVQTAAHACAPAEGASRCPADITLHARGGLDVLRVRPTLTSPGTLACIDGLTGPGDQVTWTTQVAWADADADGDPDLAVVAKGGLRVFESNGVSTAGVLDLGGALVQLVEPWGTLESHEVWGSRVDWGDADHDGDLDLAWHDAVNGLRVFVRDSAAPTRYVATTLIAAAEMSPRPTGVGVGWIQLDADRDLELVATLGANFVLFDRQPDGRWTRTTSVAAPDGGFVTTFDRLFASSGQVFFAGTHSLNGGSYIGTWGRGIAVGDVDRDGKLDVALGNWEGVYLHRGGEAGFGAPEKVSVIMNADVYGVGMGDLDGNGSLDIYGAAHQAADSVMLQRAGGGFDTPTMPHLDRPGVSIVSLGAVAPFDTGLCSQ
jgi:hypothetical protein